MVVYCILIGLAVYYAALWIWYRRTDNSTSRDKADGVPFPQEEIPDYTLIGESRYKGGQIDPQTDKAGHLPQAVENDTIFAPEAAGTDETPGYAGDEPDYEDEEIAGYMADDETGQATGVEFKKLVEAVRTVNTPNPAEADKQQAAETLGQITGTNLYDAVVANINGELEKVAELLKRNEAAAIPTSDTQTAGTNEEYRKFDMNEFL